MALPGEFEDCAEVLAGKIRGAVAEAVRGESRVAVAFSGGVDSSVLARCAAADAAVTAVAGFAAGSRDAGTARRAAAALGVELATVELTPQNVSRELGEVDLPFPPTLMDRSLWCLYALVSRKARDGGAKVILLGQMADELFGGYARYSEAIEKAGGAAAESLMSSDAREYSKRGKERDVRACSRWAEPRFPYEMLASVAGGIPLAYKISGGVRKAVLRRAAVILGVPEEVAGAPKKAAQYSSGVQKLVARAPFNAPA
ncbi:MAG: hypothetical protein JRN33_03570 [Nitrososphaerota archaeon]|nr:hypothetical protein [Nitrososphaerota archaeon]